MSRNLLVFLLLLPIAVLSQDKQASNFSVDAQYYYGTLLRHNKNIAHLVREHPAGVVLSFNKKTYGDQYWQESYNYPDWGISFIYQDFRTQTLGQNFGLYGHYNFYFLNRHLLFRLGEGIGYTTNPFDIDTNFKNIAYGSKFLATTYLLFQYEETIWDALNLNVGISFVHHSNGSFKAPNSGTNVLGFNAGLKYHIDQNEDIAYIKSSKSSRDFSEPIKFNFVFRSGVNEGDFFNLGQHPFYVFSAFADKRLNYQSTIQLGVEYFISEFLQREIEYVAASFPGRVDPDTDYKRAAFLFGHEFRLGKFAIPTQLGVYFYWPYEYESRVYTRLGAKYYISDTVFGVATVKTHAANAENIEFGIGIRI